MRPGKSSGGKQNVRVFMKTWGETHKMHTSFWTKMGGRSLLPCLRGDGCHCLHHNTNEQLPINTLLKGERLIHQIRWILLKNRYYVTLLKLIIVKDLRLRLKLELTKRQHDSNEQII